MKVRRARSCVTLLSAAERRGTPVLLSASVSDNSGKSPQVAAPRRPREIDQRQRFHVGFDNRAIFVLTLNHTLPLGYLLSYLCICHHGMTYNYVDLKTRKLPTIVYLNNKCCVNAFIRSSNTKHIFLISIC